jgi:hypothetical protein
MSQADVAWTAHRPRPMLQPMRWLGLATLAASLLGCDVDERPTATQGGAYLPCSNDADCESDGACLAERGICTTANGALGTILFEIAPQAVDPDYGSGRIFELVKGLAQSSPEALVLNVPDRVEVTGRVDAAAPEQDECTNGSLTGLPVSLVFTPRERLFGLSVPAYELESVPDRNTQEHTFSGSLLPGTYDVYMRRRPDLTPPVNCNQAPQLFRSFNVEDPYNLVPEQRALELKMPWRDDLEGWTVDMIHPITGEVISTQSTLEAARAQTTPESSITFTLHYSLGGTRDLIREGEELVRLSPPRDVPAGTVFFQRSGLELFPGQGTIGNAAAFTQSVDFQAWVWDKRDLPVRGSVEFVATSLAEVDRGVFAAFTRTAEVDAFGQVHAQLLPGEYRVRVIPSAGTGLGASQHAIPVRVDVSAQAGHVFRVPDGAVLSGSVRLLGSLEPVADAQLSLTPASSILSSCQNADANDPSCSAPLATVLQKALGKDPFLPRARAGLTRADGSFEIDELDCRFCSSGLGARFTLTVRPPLGSGLAWAVVRALNIDVGEARDPLLRAPVARPVQVTFGTNSASRQALPSALVRAYVLLDGDLNPIRDPEGLLPCSASVLPAGQPCIQTALQVAEARSDRDGKLLLLLPAELD